MLAKKLSLSKETLCGLAAEKLTTVAGGGYISMPSNCGHCTVDATCFCPNSGHYPCSLRTGCCPNK